MKLSLLTSVAATLAACAAPPAAVAPSPTQPSIVVTEAMGSPHVGDLAPDFDLPDQTGRRVRLSESRGSVVVLAFVASFCPFSRAEQPALAQLAVDYAGRNVRFIAIGIDEPEADYRSYLARVPMRLPVLRDEGGEVALRFTPPGAQPLFRDRKKALVTSNLVLDGEGRIRFFTVLDTTHFDAKLVHVRDEVDRLLASNGA
ncbi:MAG TPA: TlpA disulfide reductase family protein [Polyangiaceae bacterium]|nr:TlpA disulfide reductase family protein [Polyangiaceae bacterium]